jgi:hypothetical protein
MSVRMVISMGPELKFDQRCAVLLRLGTADEVGRI